MTITLTLKTLTTLGIPKKFTYHKLALRVSSGVFVLGCSLILKMTLRSKENLRKISLS